MAKKVIAPKKRELGKSYDPSLFENEVYQFWESSGCFEASDTNKKGQQSFCIMIPPPNVTGALHMGHALTNTIQDILIRWRRMKGDNALWMPGTDHAGIATQMVVERELAKKGVEEKGQPITRYDLGRKAFLEKVWEWKRDHGNKITHQLKKMGSSFDWSRERFTMDEGFTQAVREAFVRLYEEGLIYRGEKIINWDVKAQTALSDLEVVPTERKSTIWDIQYAVVDDEGNEVDFLTVATTRPETLLGDTAVAVDPEDERYQAFIGKKVKLPLLGKLIPVVADDYVERDFGTGVVKITPAHDFNDFEVGLRHQLPIVSVMGKDGKITAAGGPYVGLDFKVARERILQDLKESGALLRSKEHKNMVGISQRSDTVVEPMISKQWFVKIDSLAKPAIEAVETGKIEFRPKTWEKTYFEWMYNIRDWCISRQLWWGHQIPAWYCGRCQEMTVARKDPEECPVCKAPTSEMKQDEDVLDTWFSSGLWPMGTLGWPEKTQALKTFYPTAILETGFDIIFFWVARMIMMGLHFTGEVPFKKVYLHAMVRDEHGKKMSKSKGNVIDPLTVVSEYGADALRFTLAIMAGQGRDVKLSLDRVAGYRAFCNKVWNATKYFHLKWKELGFDQEPKGGLDSWVHSNRTNFSVTNRWILSRLQDTIEKVNRGLSDFELNLSSQSLYDFVWGEFCDWYLEFSKISFQKEEQEAKETLWVLRYVLEQVLILLHPIVPHVTEELWQSLPWIKCAENTKGQEVMTLMLQQFPEHQGTWKDAEAEKTMSSLKSAVEAIRAFRGENRISPKKEFQVNFIPSNSATQDFIKLYEKDILTLCRVSSLNQLEEGVEATSEEAVIPLSQPAIEFRIPLKGLVDLDEESKRLKKEIEKVTGDLKHVQKKLSKESFIAKAPAELVAREKEKEKAFMSQLKELEGALGRLSQ